MKRKKYKNTEEFLENVKIGDLLYYEKSLAIVVPSNWDFSIFMFKTNMNAWKNRYFYYHKSHTGLYYFEIIQTKI